MDGESALGDVPILQEHVKLGGSARAKFAQQGYRLVGDHAHSAVKVCHWTKSALKGGASCYKNTFYGIASERCLQMTPSLPSCNYACNFCWRDHFGNKPTLEGFELDGAEEIMTGAIEAQRTLLTGYKGHAKVAIERWLDAQDPKHVAISLNGEPTNYPHMSELLAAAHRRGITTYLVTNGSNPEIIRNLDPLPTQLYLSVDASNKEMFHKICNPLLPDLWERFQQTVDILGTLPTRTVVRNTLVKGWNMDALDEYAALLGRANPTFIESKGYSHMGASMNQLGRENMPTHEEVRTWTRALVDRLPGYEFVNERAESRVTLLSRIGPDTVIPGLEANVRPVPTATRAVD